MDKVQEYRVYLKNLIMRQIGMSQEYRLLDPMQGRIGGARGAYEAALKEFNRIFEEQPAQPAESLREMAKRMCESRKCLSGYVCDSCPITALGGTPCLHVQLEAGYNPEIIIPVLRNWASENPPKHAKTYREDFFEKFPEAPRTDGGFPRAKIADVYDIHDNDEKEFLHTCESACWDKPLGYWEA